MISFGLGMIVGVILALTGAGGGILAVPLLIFGVGLSVAEAGPIGLLAIGMASALGAAIGLKVGTVRYKAALLMAAGGMLLSPLGVWLAHRVDNRWLSILFAVVLLYVAGRTFRQANDPLNGEEDKHDRPPPCIRDTDSGHFAWTSRCACALSFFGSVAGLLSGLLGVGGGFVMVPALQRYTDLAMKSIVATSLTVIALVSVSGVAASAVSGHLNWVIALPFAAGALSGMLGGRLIASHLAAPQLQRGFAVVAAIVAIGLIARITQSLL